MGCPKLHESWRFVSAEPADVGKSPFRFSSEHLDSETNLVYYNYRYYSPELGRWLSRDPIEESGGANVYGFVGDDGVNKIDYLGKFEISSIWDNPVTNAIGNLLFTNLSIALNLLFGDKGTPASNLPTFKVKGKNFQIIYVNGVYNTEANVRGSAQALQDVVTSNKAYDKARVGFIHNKTGLFNSDNILNTGTGKVYDMIQVVLQKYKLILDSTSEAVARATNNAVENGACMVYLVGHSQGAAVINAAWDQRGGSLGGVNEKNRDRVRLILNGGANTFGFPGAKSVKNIGEFGDVVSGVVGNMSPWSRLIRYVLGHDSNESDTTLHNIGVVGDNHGFQKAYVNAAGKQIQEYLKEDTK